LPKPNKKEFFKKININEVLELAKKILSPIEHSVFRLQRETRSIREIASLIRKSKSQTHRISKEIIKKLGQMYDSRE